MGVSPISMGTSSVGFSGFGSSNDSSRSISLKITTLENQKKQYEEDLSSGNITDKALSSRIESLERRIETLKSRLDKEKNSSEDDGECQTCENRRYQDGSDDPGVSFKSATKISPEAASSAVRGHEMEHVYRNRAKAEREGREIVSQSVTIKTGICPECGKPYVAGGETRTVTRAKQDDRFNAGLEDDSQQKGRYFSAIA